MAKKMVTAAIANKMLNGLTEEKNYLLHVERSSCTYVVGLGEEPVIPEYSYSEVSRKIDEVDRKIVAMTHALNVHNTLAEIKVGHDVMSVDMILGRVDQLSKRKSVLGKMRKNHPISRIANKEVKNTIPEFLYINYDMKDVCGDYDKISEEILMLQNALDEFNQTVLFEIEE